MSEERRAKAGLIDKLNAKETALSDLSREMEMQITTYDNKIQDVASALDEERAELERRDRKFEVIAIFLFFDAKPGTLFAGSYCRLHSTPCFYRRTRSKLSSPLQASWQSLKRRRVE